MRGGLATSWIVRPKLRRLTARGRLMAKREADSSGFRATEDRVVPRLGRQRRGKSKTIPTAPGNRLCAELRGGGRSLS
jgi:hypothetical protein